MASALHIAGMGWSVTVLGWLLSPIIGLLLNKILPYLGFDASQKLRDLEIHTIPELKRTLREVEEQRMLREARKESSNVDILNKLATMLRSALYEAEDILDLIDYHKIEKVIGDGESHDNSWPQRWVQRLYDAVGTGFARCNRSWMGRCRSAALLRWARQSLCWLGRCVRAALHRSAALLPISCPPSVSLSSVRRIRCWSGSFDFNNCCRSIFVWSANAIDVARFYRNWSYDVVGITSYQEDGIPVDSFLPTIARWNLKKRIEKLENTITGVQKSPLLKQERSSTPNDIANMNRRSIRSIAARKVFGRDNERNMITNVLRGGPDEYAPSSSSSKCYSAIGIYGVAGSGKTTLAEYVCDYEKEAKYFSPIMCIYVSETFRVEDIFRDMLEEITKDREEIRKGRHSNTKDRRVLKARLQEELRDRRFLLVLDDLCDVKDRQELEELLSPLNVGESGSKILVTSRRKDAPLVAQRPIAISDLSEEQYLSMFMHYALDDTSVDDREYIKIGSEIAKNLHKSPIAAVTVAGQLWRNLDLGFWRTVANLDLLNQTMGALWWSYQQLDVDVRRCFEYCSIFPRRYELERDKLVRMWIAQGFVKATKASEDIKDVGKSYFCQLQSCSFLQLKRKISTSISSGEYFSVHDLLHDLAERVAGSDCFKIVGGIVGQISHDVRHLFIEPYGETVLPEQIFELKNLRTLFVRCSVKDMSKEDFERVFMSLRKLRVVHLELLWMKTIPGCIGQLKHLRYLGIFALLGPINMTLPDESAELHHLQGFFVPPRTRLHFSSSEKMTNLINKVETCPTRWVAFASSSTNPGGVVESETSLQLDSGASFHAVGDARLLTGIVFFSIDMRMYAVLPDDTLVRIVGTGTLQMDGFSIPKVHLVDGLKTNLISVSQLDKDHGLCCCFHGKQCQVIGADGTIVGGGVLDDGLYELCFLEVPPEPEVIRVEICPTRSVAFASSSTNPGGVAESKTSLLLDSGAGFHAVGEARLLTGIELFSIDKWVVSPDGSGTRLRIVGTGTLQTDRFSIPKVHLVDGLKKNLISVIQLDKDHGLCCSFHSKICEVILADGTVVGGAKLLDGGMYELRFLEVPPEPEE